VFTCSTGVVVESEARGTASRPLRCRCTRTVARDGESAAAAAARRQPPAARAGTGHPGPHPRRQCCGPHNLATFSTFHRHRWTHLSSTQVVKIANHV
jgi:hypothetical protein